jgi:hypothetical protein
VELFLSLPQEQAYVIRQKLLEALGAESTNSVRNKVGDAVAEIAREYSDGSAYSRRYLLSANRWQIPKTDAA